MESTHWTKIRRVTPWLLPDEDDQPEREHVVDPESMIDITQSMACIQCGACVSACLSMEADPEFIGPAALAKAYRFVGDPRDAQTARAPLGPRPGSARDLRLHPLLRLHRRLPQGRRADGPDHAPAPRGGRRARASTTTTTGIATRRAFVKIIEKKGTLDESLLLQESYAPGVKGKLIRGPRRSRGCSPRSRPPSAASAPARCARLKKLIPGVHPKLPGDAQDHVKRIYAPRRGARRRAQPLHHGRGGRRRGRQISRANRRRLKAEQEGAN